MDQSNETNRPLISVIMPAYNAERFIGRAIESVLHQTYSNIELVIVNDASTDNTCSIIRAYDDSRIVLRHNDVNSGSAYLPRKLAFDHSRGKIVVLLDSDDYLEEHYIEKLYLRMAECNADVCCAKMVIVDEEGNDLGRSVPRNDFDYSVEMTGREAFLHTVPEWLIGMNGCMAKREAWDYGFSRTYKPGKRGIHDDENFSRYILLWAKKVVFAKANHYYTMNSGSVTHVFNERIFDWRVAENDLLSLIGRDFGENSEEYKAVTCNNFLAYSHALIHFAISVDSVANNELARYLSQFKKWHDSIQWHTLKAYVGSKRYLIHKNFYVEVVLVLLRKRKPRALGAMLGLKIKGLPAKLQNNSCYKWYIYRRQREKMLRKQIFGKYSEKSEPEKVFPAYVINVIDGTIQGGGLADRLRGIISTYVVCKEMNQCYKLIFTFPFDLEQYLEPAAYDWRIDDIDICRNVQDCEILILDATEDSPYQFKKQENYLKANLKGIRKQTQVFTNAGFAYDRDYAGLFHELFKPSERLQASMNQQLKELGEEYISVSGRFLDLLGDFNETYGYGKALPEDEAKKLLNDSVEQIRKIHEMYPDNKILVNSDSTRFLEAAGQLEYTYSIPGTITHIDNRQDDSTYERYEKTFLDFLMIANASKIFLIKGNKMHKSGYPYAASLINNKEFQIIEF